MESSTPPPRSLVNLIRPFGRVVQMRPLASPFSIKEPYTHLFQHILRPLYLKKDLFLALRSRLIFRNPLQSMTPSQSQNIKVSHLRRLFQKYFLRTATFFQKISEKKKKRKFYEFILVDTKKVEITHVPDKEDPSKIAYSKFKTFKVINPTKP